jgi:trehalose 6-phosphate phosphatase
MAAILRSVQGATTLSDAVAPLRADPAHSAVLLDVDGTLAPIVRYAEDAHLPESTRALLIQVARRYAMVACVSGRQAPEARRIVSLGTITYVGNHGSELLRAGTTKPEIDGELRAWARRLHQFADDHFSPEMRRLRVRPEDKGTIVALHWRGAPDEDEARAAIDPVARAAEAAGFHLHWGRKVLEIRPPVKFDKGTGITRLLRNADIDVALYAGDDSTDLDAFRALASLAESGRIQQAVRVAVRSEELPPALEAEADVVVDGTKGVSQLLELLLHD